MPLVRKVSVENFKSIKKLEIDLGRVNVLIGANGSGKSNILEAIAVGSAAGARRRIEPEYLVPRGVRITESSLMASAFGPPALPMPIGLTWSVEREDMIQIILTAWGGRLDVLVPMHRDTLIALANKLGLKETTPG